MERQREASTLNEEVRVINECDILEYVKSTFHDMNPRKKIGQGLFGAVYNIEGYAVKVFRQNRFNIVHNDGVIMERLQGIECIPKLYSRCNNFMISELIKGQDLTNEEGTPSEFLCGIRHDWKERIEYDMLQLAKRKVRTGDLHGQNIMITEEGNLKIVDVGGFSEVTGVHGEDDEDLINSLKRIAIEDCVFLVSNVLKNMSRRIDEAV